MCVRVLHYSWVACENANIYHNILPLLGSVEKARVDICHLT